MSGSIIPNQTNTNEDNYFFTLAGGGGGGGGVQTITAGSNVTVSGTSNVTINAVGTVTTITAGSNVTVSGTSNVTINAVPPIEALTAGEYISLSGTSNITITGANQENFVTYNVGAGFSASPFSIGNTADQSFITLTALDNTLSYPQNEGAYQLTFNWYIRDATFEATPAGNLVVVVVNGPTVNSGSTIGQSACFVNNNILAPPTASPIACGTLSCLFLNNNDVNISIGFGNFSGQKITNGNIEIFSVSVTLLSENPKTLANFA